MASYFLVTTVENYLSSFIRNPAALLASLMPWKMTCLRQLVKENIYFMPHSYKWLEFMITMGKPMVTCRHGAG